MDPFAPLDRRAGDAIERADARPPPPAAGQARLGARALDPPADGPVGGGRAAPRARATRSRCSSTAQRRCRASPTAIAGARSHVHIAGWHVQPDFAPAARQRADDGPRDLLADAAERVPVRVLLWAGAPLPVFPPRGAAVRDARDALVPGHADRVRARRPRAPAPLPPREARDRRRPRRVRRRHRPHGAGRRPLRLAAAPDRAAASAGTTSPRGCAGRPSPTSPRTSACAGRRSRASGCRRRPRRRRPGDAELQVVRTVPERIYDCAAARRVPDPRGLHARAALGARARLSREPVPVVAGDRRDPRARSCATRRPTGFRVLVVLPAEGRTTAPTTPAASSACSPTPTTAPAASSPARSTPRDRRSRPTASTCTRRSESSTTAG